MSMSMVSRRVVGHTKGKRKSAAPAHQSLGAGEMIGERAPKFVPMMAGAAPKPAAGIWSQKSLLKGLAMLVGALLCASLAYFVFKGRSDTSRDRTEQAELQVSRAASPAAASPMHRRPGRPAVSAGGQDVSQNPALAERSGLTDTSFLATAYVRKKVALPNISGVCTVKANGAIDVEDCLRRQE